MNGSGAIPAELPDDTIVIERCFEITDGGRPLGYVFRTHIEGRVQSYCLPTNDPRSLLPDAAFLKSTQETVGG